MTRRVTRRSAKLAESSFNYSPSVALVKEESDQEEISCPWLQTNELPFLGLPESSSDLLIESDVLFPVGEIYETCTNYYRLIQISPFLFEDFCCALRAPEQSRLLSEIHIAFIRLFFRDDEDNLTSFCAQDTNNWMNIMVQLLDGMTYAEVLRYYLESDPRFDCQEIIDILAENYPFVETEKRVTVLKWLCDFFLHTPVFKQLISSDGHMDPGEICRSCGKPGEVILCDGCEACYHADCVELQEVPEGEWFCPVCQVHLSRDAIDSKTMTATMEKHRYRIPCLGYDRHSRMYWFFARRIFIQDSNGANYYYSTLPQLYELVRQLDPVYYEKELCAKLSESLDEIARQMGLTLKLTRKRRQVLIDKIGATRETPNAYLDVDNSFRVASILGENFAENNKMETNIDEVQTLLAQIRQHLKISNGRLTDTFWSGNMDEQQLTKLQNSIIEGNKIKNGESVFLKTKMDNLRRGYRLSFGDGNYRNYRNEYSTNELAKPFKQRAKERDKKKYLSARFSLTDEGEFQWALPSKNRDYYANESIVCKIIQHSVKRMIEKIPDELFHRLWREQKQSFVEKLVNSTTIADTRYQLLQLERAIRKPVFTNIWWGSLGITRLMRVTSDDRDEKAKFEAIRKKDEKYLQTADPNVDSDVIFVKYIKARPTSLSLWRLKDEGYRLNNRYDMGGWLWTSSTFVRNFQEVVRPPKHIDYLNPKANEFTPAVKKVLNLYGIVRKLSLWRDFAERREGGGLHGYLVCYAPNCFYSPLGFTPKLKCYNSHCPRIVAEFDATQKVKAQKKTPRFEHKPAVNGKVMLMRRNVEGEGKPFAFPKPYTFMSRSTKKRSLLILPQAILKRMARQGGTSAAQYLPGFNKQAKSNNTVWIYPCARPLFDNCWRYMTLNATTFHALSFSLRLMFACISWSEMHPEEGVDNRVLTHFPDHDERRWVVSHKEHAPDGWYEQYKTKVNFLSIDDGNDDDDSTLYRAGGSAPRSRKRKATKSRQSVLNSTHRTVTKVEERWVDGVDLRPHEISAYWRRWRQQIDNQR